MKKRNRKTKKLNYKKVSLCILVVFLLSLFILQGRNDISVLEKGLRDIFLTPLNLFHKSVSYKESIEQVDITDLELENDELRKEVEELKSMLLLTDMLSDKVVVTANIMNRNINFFFDTITINKGTSSGITEGMAVVAGTGLVGKTIHVGEYYSDVQLLTGKQMGKVSVKIKNNDAFVYGILSGYNSDNNVYYIEGISQTTEVPLGAEVTTTGMGDIFPSGILVGTVSNITTDHFDLAKIIEVTPSVNINDFSVVSILKRNVNT